MAEDLSKILVVVDMQNDFISGSLGTKEAKEIVPKVVNKIKNADWELILFTKDTHEKDYLLTQEGKNLPVEHCIRGTDGWCIDRDVRAIWKSCENHYNYSCEDIVNSTILKNTFGSSRLVELIKEIASTNPIDEIELCGLCTGICVISNALLLKAYFPETKISVDASCCACVTPESHKNALNAMRMCQINIIGEET